MVNHKPNPDDRSDNVERIQSIIVNTIDNMQKAEESIECANEKDFAAIEAKNERRRDSLESLRAEVSEEAHARKNGYTE